MKPKLAATLIAVGAFLAIAVLWGIGTYNRLVTLNEGSLGAWSQVQNQYQRRVDLIPNLVQTVKGYAKHEQEVLDRVVTARSKVGSLQVTPEILKDPQAFQKFERAQGELSSALSRLLAVAENYPNLKANENFLQLQAQLEGTENRIAVERKRFNETVQSFNTKVRVFPTVILAGLFGFAPKSYFQSQPGAETPPVVQF